MDWRTDSGDYLSHSARAEFLVPLLARIPKWSSILDVGCNAGRDLMALYKAGWADLTGIDCNDAVLSLPWPISLIRSDTSILTRIRPRSYDCVLGIASLEHIHDEAVIRAVGEISTYWIALVTIGACGESYHPWWYQQLWPNHKIIDKVSTDVYGPGYQFFLWERKME